MKNLKPDKIYLSLTNLNIQTFPHLCQEHCTYEFMNIFIYYYGGGGGRGWGEIKEEKRMSVQVQVFFSIYREKQ